MPLFGSKSASHHVHVLTVDHLIDGPADLSGQILIRLFVLTGVSMRAARGGTAPEPLGATWTIGEDYGGIVAVAPTDASGHGALERFADTGRRECRRTSSWDIPGARRDRCARRPEVLANLARLMVREPEVKCLVPGATLGPWRPSLPLLFMTRLQGIVVASQTITRSAGHPPVPAVRLHVTPGALDKIAEFVASTALTGTTCCTATSTSASGARSSASVALRDDRHPTRCGVRPPVQDR